MAQREGRKVTKALNEWAVVVKALGEGRQICLIRKNRIVSHRKFALYPTYASQRKRAIQDRYHNLFKEAEEWERDGHTEIHYWAALDRIIEINDVEQLMNLSAHYIWEPSHVEDYCSGQESVFLILLRVFQLDKPQVFQRQASPSIVWRNLERPLETQQSRPMLAENEFTEQVTSIEEDLGLRPETRASKSQHDAIQDMIYEIGRMEGRISEKEYALERDRLDVAWKKVPAGNPSEVFEVHIGGDFFKTLAKLKHAWDLWNSKPFLVTTDEYAKLAKNWIAGSFHEVEEVIKIVDWTDIQDLHTMEGRLRDLKGKLGL